MQGHRLRYLVTLGKVNVKFSQHLNDLRVAYKFRYRFFAHNMSHGVNGFYHRPVFSVGVHRLYKDTVYLQIVNRKVFR